MCYQLKHLKKQPEKKKFRLEERDSNPWPCDTGAMLYPLNYQVAWIDGQLLWVRDIPDDSEIHEYEYLKIIYVNCGWKHEWNLILAVCYQLKHIIRYITNSQLTRHLSMWLGSSVDRALHRYRKVMGSNLIQAWIFFRLLFQLLKLIAHCEDQISLMFHRQFTYMIFIYSYSVILMLHHFALNKAFLELCHVYIV